jgi:ribose/xylose/arabinose/galactoside ABC-type transport system permease subunit
MTAPLPQAIGRLRELRILLVVAAFGLIMVLIKRDFFSPARINIILLYLACYAIIACGMTVLLVSGGFDLSVGSVAALSAMVAAVLMKDLGVPWPIAVVAGLMTGAAVGLLNGVTVATLGINPFITTLGTMLLARGLTHIVSGGIGRSGFSDSFCWIGQGKVAGIQMPIIISLLLVAVFDLLLRKNRFFRQNYYVGGNEQAAWLSGIAVNRVKLFNYCLSGTLAALAGLVFASKQAFAAPNAGEGDEHRRGRLPDRLPSGNGGGGPEPFAEEHCAPPGPVGLLPPAVAQRFVESDGRGVGGSGVEGQDLDPALCHLEV